MPSSSLGSGAWADGQGPLGVLSAQPPLFVFEHCPHCTGKREHQVSVHAPSHESTPCTAACLAQPGPSQQLSMAKRGPACP